MANNIVPSIDTLPVEILHRIFDNLDVQTIIFSIRSLSRLFRSIVNTYDRYDLDLKLISKENFYVLCRLINPQNVISLTLSNDYQSSDQIDLFISLVHLKKFTRLRSLILDDIDDGQLNLILKQIKLDFITSFSFKIRKYDNRRIETTKKLFSSIIAKTKLRKLEFGVSSERLSKMSWPINCSIHHLIINNSITTDNLCKIFQSSPYLHKLIIKQPFSTIMNNTLLKSSFHTSFQQLKYLTIEEFYTNIDILESFLLLTPSLVYLKLTGRVKALDGKRWEEFIQINLPHLDTFEFYFNSCNYIMRTLTDVELIIGSFQTPFWIEYKKWFVTCEYEIGNSCTIYLYSLPICKSTLTYIPNSQKISLSTYSMTLNNNLTIMNNVSSLYLDLSKINFSDIETQKTITNNPMFPKVTKIDISIGNEFPMLLSHSLSIFTNIFQIVQIKLCSGYFNEFSQNTLKDIGIILEQAHNLSSLIILNSGCNHILNPYIKNIDLIVPHHVKYLQIPLYDIEQIQKILEKCQHLSIIQLDPVYPNPSQKVIEWFTNNTINSTCLKEHTSVTVWIGRKHIQSMENIISHKRIKLTNNSSNS